MRLDLTVTHIPDIKSKQPWPRLGWLGKQTNDLLLLDSRRLKVLCLNNGKNTTKKKIAKLQSHLGHLVATNISPNGTFLVCLLESGNLLIYQKDSDVLKTVPGIDQIATNRERSGSNVKERTTKGSPAPLVFISSNANQILVVIGHNQLFLWEIDQSVLLSSTKQHILKGTWSRVDCEGATLPNPDCKEVSVHAMFFTDSVLGFCCICSFVFNHRSNVQISCVFLHWLEPYHIYTTSQPRFTAQWSNLSVPFDDLSESAEPIRHRGAFLSRHAQSGHTLAVAVNQRSPVDTRVLFISIVGSTAVIVDMKGCGCRKDNIRTDKMRSYWLADIAWTPDDLFLACVTKQGCLTMLSRLGEAVLIQSSGCSVELEPSFYLPFHPLVTFVPTGKQRRFSLTGSGYSESVSLSSSIRSESDEKRQRYSLATHPSLPLLLLSDGYLVTIIKLPGDLSCTGVIRDFLSEGRTAVNLLLEKQGLQGRRLRSLSTLQQQRALSQTEAPSQNWAASQTLNSTVDGLLSSVGSDFADYAGRFSHVEQGRFEYSDPAEVNLSGVTSLRDLERVPMIANRGQRALMSAWGLAVSHAGEWTYQMDDLLQYTAKTLVKLFSVMLRAIRTGRGQRERDQQYISVLYAILNLFKASATVLHWDVSHRHCLPTVYAFIKGTVGAILRNSGHHRLSLAPRCCVGILQYCEKLLTNVYSLVAVHQPTICSFRLNPYHRADMVEGALLCQDCNRIKGTMDRDDHVMSTAFGTKEIAGSRDWTDRQEMEQRAVVVRHSPAKRLVKTWKLLHRHLVTMYRKLVKDSSIRHDRGVQKLLLLLCGVQMKLGQLGCRVSVSPSNEWNSHIDAGFLRGCQFYLQGYPEEAVACWQRTAHQTKDQQEFLNYRSKFASSGCSTLLTSSLLAILYTHLEQYNLVSALSLIDTLVSCYGLRTEVNRKGQRREDVGKLGRLTKSTASFLGWKRDANGAGVLPQLPCIPDPLQREAVQSLARFMALYFTNHPLFVFPPCAAKPLLPLHHKSQKRLTSRTVPVFHDRVASSVRQQQLSDVWTADTAMALLLVCGLLPEAVWLARELGDWKSALMLSVIASQQQTEFEMVLDDASSCSELFLPENLTPLVIVKEGISVILQTPLAPPSSPEGGSSVKRNSSFNEQDRRRGSFSLSVSTGMRRSSSMCSINEEDRIMQEQLCRSLTDMLTAATVADLDPTPWLLSSLMDRCLSLVAEFNTLVPEEFYLPAPPFYCPQPDYEPKDLDPEEVLFESSLRREVNDVIQLIMLVLNSARCSLPCARWYVQQLDLLLTMEARKKKTSAVLLPSVLVDHARFPLDLLKTGIDSQSLPHCTVELLRLFRDLCSTVWMLHSRDKLTLAVRKYQASRERSLRVKPHNNAEITKHSELLEDVLMWADNLYPFSSFLNLEEEVQDILLTAISELPPTKKTVAILARHFHENTANLSPLLQEKFNRLAEKLKRKKEVSARKIAKKNGKENKRILKYETLYRHYRYQCKLRKLIVTNRLQEIGKYELQVFEELTENDEPRNEKDGGKNGAECTTHGSETKNLNSSNLETSKYPPVGSREFESSLGYLNFLETFFLVAFGKIMQDSAPFSSKPKLPLIKAYSSDLRLKEFGSVSRRMSGQAKFPTVELNSSNLEFQISRKDQFEILDEGPERIKSDLEEESRNRVFKSRSMFHRKHQPSEDVLLVISLKKSGSRSSLNSFAEQRKEKTTSQRSKGEPTSSKQGFLTPYSTINLNLSKVYEEKAELLQWFGRWAERQLAVYAQTAEQNGKESKAVLRVRLPQQLVLNSLWLIRHVYHAVKFQTQTEPLVTATRTLDEVHQPPRPQLVESSTAKKVKRRRKRKKDSLGDVHQSEELKQSKTKQSLAMQNYDTDSQSDTSDQENRKPERPIPKKTKQSESLGINTQHREQDDLSDVKQRKKRKLPVVTQVHRSTSPSNLPINKKAVNQLLKRAAHSRAGNKTKPTESFLNGSNSEEDFKRGTTSANIVTNQRENDSGKDTSENPRNGLGTDASDLPQSSLRDGHALKSKGGILVNDIFYYSDSDTNSTLDISSLDGENPPEQENWLLDMDKSFPTTPEVDISDVIQQQSPPKEIPKSLNLNMKDADVKRLVREEFMRIMMEKSKTNSRGQTDGSLPNKASSPDTLQLPKGSSKEIQSNSAQNGPKQQALTRELRERPEVSENSAQVCLKGGIDVETQAPSPLHCGENMQASIPKGIIRITDSALHEAGRQDVKTTGLTKQTEPVATGLDRLRAEWPSRDVPNSEIDGVGQDGFKPDVHSTARNADSRRMGKLSEENEVKERTGLKANEEETESSSLSLQDLDHRDKYNKNTNGHHGVMQQELNIPKGNRDQQYGMADQQTSNFPLLQPQSALGFAMQIPVLLTVPADKLSQGGFGAPRPAYPPPPQRRVTPQPVDPPLVSRQAPTDSATFRTRQNTHRQQPSSNFVPNERLKGAFPRNTQAASHPSQVNFPPVASDHSISHLISFLHPGVQHPRPYANHDNFPPIPLLHLEPRHPTPIIPPPRPHFIPLSNPTHPQTNPQTNPGRPLPLLKFRDDSKPPQLVPLDELDAFERNQRRQELGKHPAVRAREHLERMEGKNDDRGPEMPASIPLLHAELRNDLSNPTRQKRRQQHEGKGPTTDSLRPKSADPSKVALQSRRPQSMSFGKNQKMEQKVEETNEESTHLEQGTSVKKLAPSSEDVETNVLKDSSKDSVKMGGTFEKHDDSSSSEDSKNSDENVGKKRNEDLGKGFAIKPGSFDALLQDRDARPAIPTAAQVHYDTVQQLQTKPKPRNPHSGVKETKNVSTTMGKDDFPHHAPTVSEAVSQYTTAATGVAPSGQIVGPDIFFNLRFGSSTSDQQASLQNKGIGKDTEKPTKGRTFISVVDVDLTDIPSPTATPLPQNPKETVTEPPPLTHEETLATPPTNAQLHYDALFLKDAHPKKSPPKVMFETSAEETKGGPDAVTVKLLETKTKENSRQIENIKARSESARQSTKDRLSQRLAQMDQQLVAIEESAANIEQDFRDTSLMLHTVENLTDVMATSGSKPKTDYSLRDSKEPDRTTLDGLEAHTLDTMRSRGATPVGELLKESVATDKDNLTGIDRGDDTGLTLGISGISGVSDIIAEVIAEGDDSEVRRMGVSTRRQKAARKKVEQRRVTEQPLVHDLGHLSSDKIRELLETPRPEESLEKWAAASGKKPTERTEQERKALQEWLVKRRAQSLGEHRKQRQELEEKEHAPFRPKAGSEMVGHSTFKEIRKQEHERDKKKKETEKASHKERVQLAKALMAEIFTEKPRLPHSETNLSASTNRKEKLPRNSEVYSQRLDASGSNMRPDRRPASSQSRRGNFGELFESRAYKSRPASAVNFGRGATKDVAYNQRTELETYGESRTGRSYLKIQDNFMDSREFRKRETHSTHGTMDFKDDQIKLRASDIRSDRETNETIEPRKTYKPKAFDQVVRVQRPEVTRTRPGSAGTQKTYTEMLQEMQGETNKMSSTSQSRKAKQRLFGTTRIPGSSRGPDPATPRVTKTYSERLSEMQLKSGSQTRLVPRPRPRGVPRIDTATMTFNDGAYRRQEVERRGLKTELTPRSSTPYRESLATPSLTGTHTMRDDVVSPTPKVGVKYRPKDGGATTYVERLQRASLEAPRTGRHRTVYVGPTPRETYKSPPLRIPTTRHRPYPSQSQKSPDELGERSGFSDLSSWNVSDDVNNILQRRDSFEGDSIGLTDDDVSIEGFEYDDYAASVNVKKLEDIASISSGSIMSNIDWGAVDKMIADVK